MLVFLRPLFSQEPLLAAGVSGFCVGGQFKSVALHRGGERSRLFLLTGEGVPQVFCLVQHRLNKEIDDMARITDKAFYEYNEAEPPYLHCGIFDRDALRAELAELVRYGVDFTSAQTGDKDNSRSYFWKSGQFTGSDAMAYYAYVRRLRPRNIVEIGSGFSSLIALQALARNTVGRLHCIEPFPRPFIAALGAEGALKLQVWPAQEVTASA
ncbi:class I SAM-dependent methyltransferase [Pseudomonas sp. Au-Pse12]|nr:class I SAM-dependent methyltransferase [Pseudomonas sp. Au-Pse12]